MFTSIHSAGGGPSVPHGFFDFEFGEFDGAFRLSSHLSVSWPLVSSIWEVSGAALKFVPG